MRHLPFVLLCISVVTSLATCRAQSPSVPKESTVKKAEKQPHTGYLVPVQTIVAKAEVAASFDQPLTCDNDGNLYLQSEHFGVSGIRKLNAKGERTALFQPNANPDLKIDGVGYFALSPSGELYQFVFPHEMARYVMVYKSDGSYKSVIKLQPGFPWIPSSLAAFPSGNLLVSGLEFDRDAKNGVMWPFTGIFSSDGTLLKEVKLEDDDAFRDLAASGDARVTSGTNPQANHAVEFGQMQAADDGNVYLMRWITPTIFYAISPGGEVIRRFVVDPGDESYRPSAMHVAGNRIAVLFFQPQSMEERMKIVDLEGHEIATYDELREKGKPILGLAFACYTENPQRFTFLTTGDGERLNLQTVEATNIWP
jgi:hypothetical protein